MDNGDNTYSIKEPIMASAEHNETNGTIEITIRYSENGIAKIEDENGNSINFTNENGIIKAVTSADLGTNKFTITDNKGITKELKVTIPYVYGREVLGYECDVPNVKWRLFHADDQNIYLIADDYIPYANLPTSTNGTALNKGNTDYKAYFTNILNDYTGSSWIKENTDIKAQKWLSKYLTEYPESTNNNIKAVAYMMDTNKWSTFAGEKAEYAIGGPTIELFCASYKETHSDKYVECDSVNKYGYSVKWSGGSYSDYITGFTKDEYNSIYIKGSETKTYGMWLASSSSDHYDDMMCIGGRNGVNNYGVRSYEEFGFRPVVCLKSGVQLFDNGDNTYSIKEPIMASAEHNETDGTVEITVQYTENGIAKIEDKNGNTISFTNEGGKIKATTPAVGGRNKFIITDQKGITEEVEVSVILPIYVKLYTDGTLAFTATDKVLEGKTVETTYEYIAEKEYFTSGIPWYNQTSSIKTVDIVDKIYPKSTAYWFCNCINLTSIENISNLDTSNVINMSSMFNHCDILTQLDVSNFDTGNVTDMGYMFGYCSNLTNLDVSKFDTSKVTSMSEMFYRCGKLEKLDVSNFNTRNVTAMGYMFAGCERLTELNVSNFNTSKVISMFAMFSGCSSLTNLDLSSFDTSKVTSMLGMFSTCRGITELDLSSFDTRNVTTMQSMFWSCSNLKTIYVGENWKLAPDTTTMFNGCGTSTTTRK